MPATDQRTRLRRAAVTALAIAVPAAASMGIAGPAAAAFPGGNGRIVYVSNGGNLSTINPDGTGLTVLRKGLNDRYPAISPDGSRIAFTNRDSQLMIMSSNGGTATKLADLSEGVAWSPDGTKLVYVNANGAIATMNADGTGATPVAAGGFAPTWSPDGSTIVFSLHNGSYQLWSVPAGGGAETQLTSSPSDDFYPSFSPDGTKIAFQRGDSSGHGQIAVMNADGTGVTTLTSTGDNVWPKWSPDGSKIAFLSSRGSGLWMMNSDGSNQMQAPGLPGMAYYDWGPSHLTIKRSKGTITYGHSDAITVHLNAFATTENRTVSLNATRSDGSTRKIGSAVVDGNGNAGFTVKPSRATTYTATWSGDATHPAGGTSDSVTVLVRAKVTTTASGFYAKSGRLHYHLYHYSSSCPSRHTHCPRVTTVVNPNKAGQRLSGRIEVRRNGHWRGANFRVKLGSKSRTTTNLLYGDTSVIGLPVRIRFTYNGDALNEAANGKWVYIEVTR